MKKLSVISLLLTICFSHVFGLTNSDITYRLLSGKDLFADANNCAQDGPRANYLQIEIINNSGVNQTNLEVSLISFSNPTNFMLAGGQAMTQKIVSLPAGTSDTLYWFMRYPSCISVQTSTITMATVDADDQTSATSLVKNPDNTTTTLSNGGLISANVTGQSSPLVVTRNDNVINGIISYRARYDFNTIKVGAGIWFQPVGNLSFNAGALQLIDARICNYVDPDFVPCMLPQASPLNYSSKLNYIGTCTNNGNSNKYFYVEYRFRINQQVLTYASPYATGLSGNPYKYTYDSTYRVALNTLTALPVVMANFEVKSEDEGNLLKWTTDNEINSAKFIIERSIGGKDFEPIGELAAAGNSNQKLTYAFIDNSKASSACYRILNQDLDGKLFEHNTKCVELSTNSLKLLSIYPNPAQNEINLSFQTAFLAEEIKISLFDAQGQMVRQKIQSAELNGINNIQLSLDNLAAGIYFVKINDGISMTNTYKFVKN